MTQEEKIKVQKMCEDYGLQFNENNSSFLTDLRDVVWSDFMNVSSRGYRAALYVDYVWINSLAFREGVVIKYPSLEGVCVSDDLKIDGLQ